MKKILAMLLALCMLLCFAACTANDETPDTTENKNNVTNDPAPNTDVKVMTYAEYAAAEMDTPVCVETTIQAFESWYEGDIDLYCQSEDGAYYIYDVKCSEEDAAKLTVGTKLRVTGVKSVWDGEVEIIDATYEILDGEGFTATAADYTELLGTDELEAHMNELVAFKGLTVVASTYKEEDVEKEAPYLYNWDNSGEQGNDLYFNVTDGENTYTFTVNAYMNGIGADSEVYKAIEGLQVGDVLNLEGFLYWYNGAQLHVNAVEKV